MSKKGSVVIPGKKNSAGVPRSRGRLWRPMALTGVVALTCMGAEVNDLMFVNRVSVPIRNGKYAFDKVVGTALQGDELTVTKVDGRWLKVRFTPKSADPSRPAPLEGYVMEDALSFREVAAATTRQTGNAAEVGASGAGRGLLDSGKYAAAKGLNPDPFYKMVTDSRTAMKDADVTFEQFCREGKLDAFKPIPGNVPLIPPVAPQTAPVTPVVPRVPTSAPRSAPASQPK